MDTDNSEDQSLVAAQGMFRYKLILLGVLNIRQMLTKHVVQA
jgi:hypothetical protein